MLACLGLALAVVLAYAPLWRCGFVDYDDGAYVVSNEMIQHGLNAKSLAWAFATGHSFNWHPLTWMSHMVDFQLYGANAAGHHITSLLLHLANSILLFLLLRRMTKAIWPSALAAALFALHPMHVESVAWISERKDVLSTLFWLLTVWAYVLYVERLKAKSRGTKAYYAASLVLFALGLMAKPMLVTLPFVLLLLDYWPLARERRPIGWVVEKIPFFVLAAASCVVTYLAQQRGGSVASLSDLPFAERLKGVPIAYVRYIEKTFWPVHLAVLYPVPPRWPVWEAVCAAIVLVAVTAWVLFRLRAQPYLAVGWLWFLGMLVPVIGLIQVGAQSMADRYNYVPSVGLMIMAIWAGREWAPRPGTRAPAILGCIALAVCMVLTPLQASYWKNSETLFRHALDTTQDNGVMEGSLGAVLLGEGRLDEALPHLERGVAFNNEKPGVHSLLAKALLAKKRVEEALDQFQIDVSLEPENPESQFDFGCALLENGLAAKAIPPLRKAVQLRPGRPEFRYKLGNAFMQAGDAADAIRQYEQSLRLRPNYIEAANNLAWILACSPDRAVRNGNQAVELSSHADAISGGKSPIIIGTLAAAYAEAGDYSNAVATVRRALQLAGARTNSPIVRMLRTQLDLYRARSPFRDASLPPPTAPKPAK